MNALLKELLELDREWLLHVNHMNTPWLDPVMYWITKTLFWLPLYLYLFYLIYKNYKKESWMVFIGLVITIVLADQITSSIMKPYFARLRPSQEPSLRELLHLVNNYTGGRYGFASSHAANTFGAATFCWLIFRLRYRWIGLLFLWATVMTYSRLYLGVHYPGDILVGALVGILSALAGYLVTLFLNKKYGETHTTGNVPS